MRKRVDRLSSAPLALETLGPFCVPQTARNPEPIQHMFTSKLMTKRPCNSGVLAEGNRCSTVSQETSVRFGRG
jgi:hypothetical protein